MCRVGELRQVRDSQDSQRGKFAGGGIESAIVRYAALRSLIERLESERERHDNELRAIAVELANWHDIAEAEGGRDGFQVEAVFNEYLQGGAARKAALAGTALRFALSPRRVEQILRTAKTLKSVAGGGAKK